MSEQGDFFNPADTIGRSLRSEAKKWASKLKNGVTTSFGRRGSGEQGFLDDIVEKWNNVETRSEAKKMVGFLKTRLKNVGSRGDGHIMEQLAQLQGRGVDTDD